ncbi:MAG: DEAD/DEAH box helicase [Anaerolineales bacterium]|nr:DEAD/DEAH box helicase [Anaerolineales bacterium]
MTNEFTTLNLRPQLVQAVSELGFSKPTPIQTAVIPPMLAGQDIIGQAQTGTGKTAAFALPILHNLTATQGKPQALVVAPTRELALQVARAVHDYGRFLDMHVLAIYGGQPYGRQKNRLKRGVDVVVGTPGRLLDLIKQNALDLSEVRTVVLDEADEMLSMGFIEDIETILQSTPENRQTALFSATLPNEIRSLANRYMRDPQSITIQRKHLTVSSIEQRYCLVNEEDKLGVLTRLFEVEDISSALIFAQTRAGTGELANELSVRGFPAEPLNGDLSQDAREQVLNRFRNKQISVLVATDVAARGLDIDDISHVFNFDLPRDPEIFVHRVGRTGRAGKTGIAISLVTPRERGRLRRIEGYARQKLTETAVPTEADILAHREEQLRQKLLVWLKRGRARKERDMVESFLDEGFDVIEVAAAALKLARAEEKQRPIATISDVEALPTRESRRGERSGRRGKRETGRRSHEKGMVRMVLNAGRAHGVRPNDVVGTIAYHANIPGKTIGAIRIEHEHTLVDVPVQFSEQVLSGTYHIHRQTVTAVLA